MQKITPFLWFDQQAEQAAQFYTSTFHNSKIGEITHYGEGMPLPPGTVMTATFQLEGQQFMGLNGGPLFEFTPAISFFVNCETPVEIDRLWEKLSEGGAVLMELAQYPFSEKFGWLSDQFGVSWQLNLGQASPKIVPFLMFVGQQHGKAREAIDLYVSLFEDARIVALNLYGKGEGEPEGSVKHAAFTLSGQTFMAIESNLEHQFGFSQAISFFVNCATQDEVDLLWDRLSEGGEEQQCGWLVDKFGVTWQIVPSALGELLYSQDAEKSKRAVHAMLQMQKLDIAKLKQAYDGR